MRKEPFISKKKESTRCWITHHRCVTLPALLHLPSPSIHPPSLLFPQKQNATFTAVGRSRSAESVTRHRVDSLLWCLCSRFFFFFCMLARCWKRQRGGFAGRGSTPVNKTRRNKGKEEKALRVAGDGTRLGAAALHPVRAERERSDTPDTMARMLALI